MLTSTFEYLGVLLLMVLMSRVGPLLSRLSGLPVITLYLLAGALWAQVGAVSHSAVEQLLPLHHGTLAVITFAAGGELALDNLRAHARTIRCLTLAITCSALVVVFGLALASLKQFPTLGLGDGVSETINGVASLFAAVVAIARSPSSAIAVVTEQRAEGPFTQTVLSVTMVTDVVVIVLFTAVLELAQVGPHALSHVSASNERNAHRIPWGSRRRAALRRPRAYAARPTTTRPHRLCIGHHPTCRLSRAGGSQPIRGAWHRPPPLPLRLVHVPHDDPLPLARCGAGRALPRRACNPKVILRAPPLRARRSRLLRVSGRALGADARAG